MSFFKIDLSNVSEGLSHQRSNFTQIIRYCYHNNYKLIKPIFKLNGKHNNNNTRKTDLSEYYNLDGITINGELFRLYNDNDNFKKETINYVPKMKYGLVKYDPAFSNL